MTRANKIRRRDVRNAPQNDFIAGAVYQYKVGTLADGWKRSCGNKIPYADRLDAVREALLMEEQHRKQFAVYQCTCCGKYHVGGVK